MLIHLHHLAGRGCTKCRSANALLGPFHRSLTFITPCCERAKNRELATKTWRCKAVFCGRLHRGRSRDVKGWARWGWGRSIVPWLLPVSCSCLSQEGRKYDMVSATREPWFRPLRSAVLRRGGQSSSSPLRAAGMRAALECYRRPQQQCLRAPFDQMILLLQHLQK